MLVPCADDGRGYLQCRRGGQGQACLGLERRLRHSSVLGQCFLLHATLSAAGTCAAAVVPPATAWNFAFGANMDRGTRERRGLDPAAIAPACLVGWELAFSLPGVPFAEPAFAAVRPAPTGDLQVHGVCLELDREGWLRLLQSEGVLGPSAAMAMRLRGTELPDILAEAGRARRRGPGGPAGYRLERVEVQPYHDSGNSLGSSSPRRAYVLTDVDVSVAGDAVTASGTSGYAAVDGRSLPSVRYWRLLRSGARRHGLRGDYRSFLWSYPRFLPSLAGPVALLAGVPALLAARRRQQRGEEAAKGGETPQRWPEPLGVLAGACGSVLLGSDVAPPDWNRFSSMPRPLLLDRLRQQLGAGVAFEAY